MRRVLRRKADDGVKLLLESGEWVWEDSSRKNYKPADCLCGNRILCPEPECPYCGMPLNRQEQEYSREEIANMIATAIKFGLPYGHGFRNPHAYG